MTTKVSPVQAEMWNQIRRAVPFHTLQALGLKMQITSGTHTLRLHFKKNGKVTNIDFTYDEGADLYNVKAYKLNNKTLEADVIYDHKGIFFDQFADVIGEILKVPKDRGY